MNTIRLKNGTEEASVLISALNMSISNLLNEDPIAFYELVELCRKPDHVIFSDVQTKTLRDYSLLDQTGVVHGSVRNFILSAVTGECMGLILGSAIE